MHQFAAWLDDEAGTLHHVATVNPEFIMLARRDPAFAAALKNVDLATADGVGVTLAARVQGQCMQRITGVDLAEQLAGMKAPCPKIFLLGAAQGVANAAADSLRDRYPDARIVGTYSGSPDEGALPGILDRIRESSADTLLVAFGAPAQETWIDRRRQDLTGCGIVIAIGVGGTFDYLSGQAPRAPRPIRRIGLEWLYRLIRQPWRWRRQLVLPVFAALVLKERFIGKG